MALVDFTRYHVRLGSVGPHVEAAQHLLNYWLEETDPGRQLLTANGRACENTYERVLDFQRAHGLDDHGTVDPSETWPVLITYRRERTDQ